MSVLAGDNHWGGNIPSLNRPMEQYYNFRVSWFTITLDSSLLYCFGEEMKNILVVLVSMFVLSGCATLFGDKNRVVRVESEPAGAEVYLNGAKYGRTPTTLTIQSTTANNIVTIKKTGYEEINRPVLTSLQPVAILNLLNIVCWGVDFVTGNIYRIDNPVISVDLDEKTAEGMRNESSILVSSNTFNRSENFMCANAGS